MENCDSCTERGTPKNVKKYVIELVSGEPRLEVDSRLLTYAITSLAILFAGFSLVFSFFNKTSDYFPFIIFSVITGVCAAYSHYYLLCYRKKITCTNGMMAGMTVGMIIGLMSGLIIGATNGMFVGSVAGMMLGLTLGANIGRYCGIMGAMEGIMAGFMGGTMGAMLSVMTLNDNLMIFLTLAFSTGLITLGGLTYMLNREQGNADKTCLNVSLVKFLIFSLVFSAILVVIMIYGPKGPATYF